VYPGIARSTFEAAVDPKSLSTLLTGTSMIPSYDSRGVRMVSPVQIVERELSASPLLPNDLVLYLAPKDLRPSIAVFIAVDRDSEGAESVEVFGESTVNAGTDREARLSMYTVGGR
jgi:hypothetical protein